MKEDQIIIKMVGHFSFLQKSRCKVYLAQQYFSSGTCMSPREALSLKNIIFKLRSGLKYKIQSTLKIQLVMFLSMILLTFSYW